VFEIIAAFAARDALLLRGKPGGDQPDGRGDGRVGR
jgi:hypothetical protein